MYWELISFSPRSHLQVLCSLPFLLVNNFEETTSLPYTIPEERVNLKFWNSFQSLTFIAGMLLSFAFLFQWVVSVMRLYSDRFKELSKGWLFFSSYLRGEIRIKRAAHHKVNCVLQNTYQLHLNEDDLVDTSLRPNDQVESLSKKVDRFILRFNLQGETTEKSGGFRWTWQRIWNEEIFVKEGIWFPTRLVVFQGIQIFVAVVLSFFLFFITDKLGSRAERAVSELDFRLPSWVKRYALVLQYTNSAFITFLS
jgi:hypothetical protein